MGVSRKDDLVAAAKRVFAQEGFHNSGIERVLAESGCAKMTLYNHFAGKDDLIVSALECASAEQLNAIESSLTGTGVERALSYFDALRSWFTSETFSGCLFLNAAAEFKDPDHPVRVVVREHSAKQLALLERLVAGAGVRKPEPLASQLMLLAEGAVEMAKITGDPGAATVARAAAGVLIASATDDGDV